MAFSDTLGQPNLAEMTESPQLTKDSPGYADT